MNEDTAPPARPPANDSMDYENTHSDAMWPAFSNQRGNQTYLGTAKFLPSSSYEDPARDAYNIFYDEVAFPYAYNSFAGDIPKGRWSFDAVGDTGFAGGEIKPMTRVYGGFIINNTRFPARPVPGPQGTPIPELTSRPYESCGTNSNPQYQKTQNDCSPLKRFVLNCPGDHFITSIAGEMVEYGYMPQKNYVRAPRSTWVFDRARSGNVPFMEESDRCDGKHDVCACMV